MSLGKQTSQQRNEVKKASTCRLPHVPASPREMQSSIQDDGRVTHLQISIDIKCFSTWPTRWDTRNISRPHALKLKLFIIFIIFIILLLLVMDVVVLLVSVVVLVVVIVVVVVVSVIVVFLFVFVVVILVRSLCLLSLLPNLK